MARSIAVLFLLAAVTLSACAEREKPSAEPAAPPPATTSTTTATAMPRSPPNYVAPNQKWNAIEDIRKKMPKVGAPEPAATAASTATSADAAK